MEEPGEVADAVAGQRRELRDAVQKASIRDMKLNLGEADMRAAKATFLTLSIIFVVCSIAHHALRSRWRKKAGTTQDMWRREPIRSLLDRMLSPCNCLGRAQRVTWFTCSSGFIAYYSRSVLSIVILNLTPELHLEASMSALALSAFFYGYIVANLCSLMIMRLFTARLCLLIAILGSSLLTLALPLFVELGGAWGLVLCRGGTGLLQGVLYPAIYSIYSAEFMHDASARAQALSFLGATPSLGIAGNFLVSPLLIQCIGWRSTCYVAGCLGIPWSLLWWLSPLRHEPGSVANDPQDKELQGDQAAGKTKSASGISLVKRILRTPSFYAVVCGHFAHSWMNLVSMAWLPTYMSQELGVSGESLSLTCLPYIVTAIAAPVLGMSATWLIQRSKVDLWQARRSLGLAALLLPAVGMLIFPQVPASTWPLPLIVMAASLACSTLVSVSVLATPLDIAGPQTSGLLFSMSNVCASVPGFLGVQVVGMLKQSYGWPTALASCTFLYIVAAFIYARNGSAHKIFD